MIRDITLPFWRLFWFPDNSVVTQTPKDIIQDIRRINLLLRFTPYERILLSNSLEDYPHKKFASDNRLLKEAIILKLRNLYQQEKMGDRQR